MKKDNDGKKHPVLSGGIWTAILILTLIAVIRLCKWVPELFLILVLTFLYMYS